MSEPFDGWRRIRTFESVANRFTVCPLWPLGNPSIFNYKADFQLRADERTRTVNLLITSQLLCQLSHIGILNPATTDFPGQFPTKYFQAV